MLRMTLIFALLIMSVFAYSTLRDTSVTAVASVQGNGKVSVTGISNKQVLKPMGDYNITMDMRHLITTKYYDSAFDVVSTELTGKDFIFVIGTISGSSAYTDIFIQKINASGVIEWNKTIDYDGQDDVGYRGYIGTDGAYLYVTGYTVNESTGNMNLALIKLDFDGNIIWKIAWGEDDADDYGYGVSMDGKYPNYGVYVTGYRYRVGSDTDLFVVKFDNNGNQVWNRTYDGGYNDYGYDISVSWNGAVTVVGATNNGSTYNGLILRYDYNGNLIKSRTYVNNDGSFMLKRIRRTYVSEDNMYVTGVKESTDGNTRGNLYVFDNDTLALINEANFPLPNKNSTAYGVFSAHSDTLSVTGTIVNNDEDEYLWLISLDTLETKGFYVYDSGFDDKARGVAFIVESSSSKIYFYVVAGERYTVINAVPKYEYYFDIWSPDSDSDELSNYWEIRNGTDMLNNDTDDDGLLDGQEMLIYNTDPLNNDTDGDMILDGTEVNTYNTSPLSNDTDTDGLDDYSEIFVYHTNPNNVDTDGDGLGDYEEIETYETNATNSDTDKDGMPDGWEIGNSFDPNNANDAAGDADNDGLSNLGEYQYGANPHNPDTDGDGLPDGWEASYNLNPTNASDAPLDSDDDGLTNIQEYQHGTNPLSNDTDRDGMPDGWEVNNGLNPTNSTDAQGDADNDGITNLDEYRNHTDPTKDNAPPTINSIWTQPVSPNNVTETVIYANIADTNGVAQVNLTYTINGVTHNVTMNYNSTSGYYYFSLGVLEEGTTVYYSITAMDESGNIITSNEYNFTVIGVSSEENNETPNNSPSTEKNISDYIPYIVIFFIASIVAGLSFRRMKKKG